MGRGDKKTKRGKIVMGTFGKVRPHKQVTPAAPAIGASQTASESAPKKAGKKKEDN